MPDDHSTAGVNHMTLPEDGRATDRRRALRDTLAVGLAVLTAVGAGISGTWWVSDVTVRENYRQYLTGLALAAAEQIDPALHRALDEPGEIDSPDYRRAVEPLRRLRTAIPQIAYVYTVIRDGQDVRFVLDAADAGDRDGDGIADRSGIDELYPAPDPAMLAALGDDTHRGIVAATDRPYSDRWGTFMTGYAPLFDADRRQFGAVGVEVDASVYMARIIQARNHALLGLLPSGGIILALCAIFYRMRFRGLGALRGAAAAALGAQRSAEVLTRERRRFEHVIEGTRAGIWEWDLDSGDVLINERWAAIVGLSVAELSPVTVETWKSLLHPEDVDQVTARLQASFAGSADVYEADFRMQHAAGHWVWISARGNVIERDADARPLRMAGTHVDITAAKEAELALEASEAKFRGLFESSPVGLVLADLADGRFLEVNDALLALNGYTREEFLTLGYRDITPAQYRDADRQQVGLLRETGRYGPYEKEFIRKDGTLQPVLLSGVRMKDASGREIAWSIVQDISQRKAMELRLTEAARCDRLTGLANRELFMERLRAAIGRAMQSPAQPFAVLFLDFDHFKLVNDTLGHEAGDELLRQIAGRLRSTLRASDAMSDDANGNLVARFGGDEFVVLINDLHAQADACRVAERLLNALAPVYSISGREVHSTASIGIVTSDQCLESAEAVIRNADVAMYEAKRSGRACSIVFNEAMHVRLTRHVTIESSLRKALGTRQLALAWQPIIALDSGHMVSAEALVRWEHPSLGPIPPAEFIPIAEESGLIVPLGEWVLHEACRQLAEWRQADPAHAPRTVSVNVSRAELALGKRLLTRIRDALERTGLPANCLQLEVTEREVMRDPDATHDLMHELRNIGVRLAMDDFGTGTSSLGCLRDYPFDTIKIDRSFVRELAANRDVLAVIHATLMLVENLGMSSVAEGVECAAQVAILQSLGCRYAQGYFFSPPVSPQKLLTAIHNRDPAEISSAPKIAV